MVQKLWPFSLLTNENNFDVGLAKEKRRLAISSVRYCQNQCVYKILSKCPVRFNNYGHFYIFIFWISARVCRSQSMCETNQNIPNVRNTTAIFTDYSK